MRPSPILCGLLGLVIGCLVWSQFFPWVAERLPAPAAEAQVPMMKPVMARGPAIEGLSIAASVEGGPTFPAMTPVILRVVITNTLNERNRGRLGDTAGDLADFQMVVRLHHSIRPQQSMTDFGPSVFVERPAAANVPIELDPGGKLEHIFLVNRMFDMTQAGEYEITIGRRLTGNAGAAELLEAEPIKVQIVEPDLGLAQGR